MAEGCDGVRARAARPLVGPAILMASFALALAAGCSSREQPAGRTGTLNNHPPVVTSASILPVPIVLSNPLAVRVEAQDPDQQSVTFRYRWLINKQVVAGQTGATLPPGLLKRGDQVAVEVVPSDGFIEGAAFMTAAMPVVNTPPVIQHASIDIDASTRGSQLVAHVEVADPDHDIFTITYRWTKNEMVIQDGESNRLNVDGLSAKDLIQVEVTASDGAPNGVSSRSGRFQLANSAPTITSSPPLTGGDGQYAYLVQATDVDGDPITYALETAPSGMSIDAATGQVRWLVPANLRGAHRIRVIAQDDRGGIAAQEFDLSLVPPSVLPDQKS